MGGRGDRTVAAMRASDENAGGDDGGSNVGVTRAGTLGVGQVEAAGDFTADVTGFTANGGTMAADGNILVTADNDVDLGTATAGGAIQASAQSIAFAAINAGAGVDPEAGGANGGPALVAGSPIVRTGNKA